MARWTARDATVRRNGDAVAATTTAETAAFIAEACNHYERLMATLKVTPEQVVDLVKNGGQ